VYDVVQQVFNGQMNRGYNRSLAIDLFETGRITERIVEGQQASDKAQVESNMRLGYMGHLTLIAEEVVKFTERHPPELLSQSVLDKVMALQWIDYVEQTLAETRERDNAILGGVRPDMSIGPRQAVLNAVNAAQGGYGGSGLSSGFTGNGTLSLDGVDLSNAGSTTPSSTGGYLFSGSSLLSGFNHGSSDEEDEEMDELGVESGMTGMAHQLKNSSQLDEEDQVGEISFEDVEMDYR
jgi:SIT4-associating protein SAP185/190